MTAAVEARKGQPESPVQRAALRRPLNSLDTPTPRRRRLSWFALLVALALPLSAWAGSDTPNASAAKAAAACSAAGLDPSEAPFADCVRSPWNSGSHCWEDSRASCS